MKRITILSLLSGSILFSNIADAQEVSRAEFEALLKRVEMLEQKLEQTQEAQIETIVSEVAQRNATTTVVEEKPGLIDSVIDAVQFRQEAATFPWMDAGKWASIEKGMPQEEVLELLGKPYTDEPSLRKRIDNVYTYEGRRVSNNKRVEGKIRFYRGKVVNFEAPEL